MASNIDMDKPRDFPFEAMCEQAQGWIEKGTTVFQKFTCAGCGTRLRIEEPNKFYEEGTCDQCNAVTNIREQGCNYSIMMTLTIGGEDVESKSQDHDPAGERERPPEADAG